MVYAVIFDLDGTLADTMDDLGTAINNMLEKLGYNTRTKGELIRFINNGARNFVRLSLPEELRDNDFLVDSALTTYEDEYSKCYKNKTEAYDGIAEALEGLRDRKLKLGVLSNKQDTFVRSLTEKLFDKKLFKFTLGNRYDIPKKPDPQGALLVAKTLGAKPSNCIFVGDSDVDVKTAHNAGMVSIAVTWGYRSEQVLREAGADYIVTDTEGLIDVIDKILDEKNPKRKKPTSVVKIKKKTVLSKYENKQEPKAKPSDEIPVVEEEPISEPIAEEPQPSKTKKEAAPIKRATPQVSVKKINKK
jgi:phosphoglycolate phosphatase